MPLAISGRLPNLGAGKSLQIDPVAFGRATKGRGLQDASVKSIQDDSLRLGANETSPKRSLGTGGSLGAPKGQVFNNPQVSDPIAARYFSTGRSAALGQNFSILA